MVKESNQSGYWNSCQIIAIAFMCSDAQVQIVSRGGGGGGGGDV